MFCCARLRLHPQKRTVLGREMKDTMRERRVSAKVRRVGESEERVDESEEGVDERNHVTT